VPALIIRKLEPNGSEVFRYPVARVLERTETSITVEAIFTRFERLELGYTTFERGDRFIEHFYSDRWYNVFEVRAVGDDRLRGWYCNIARPAEITTDEVAQVDLALDIWVAPDGAITVLDEDEFAALSLAPDERLAAQAAVEAIRALVAGRLYPFDALATHLRTR